MQNEAPNQPQQKYQFIDLDTGFLTSYGLQTLEQMWRQIAASFGPVPCEATNVGNLYTLTPILQKEGGRSYGDYMRWTFMSPFTSTGAVTMNVMGDALLDTIKAYIDGGATQANTGDIIINRLYDAIYNSALDGGAGGFVLK